MSDTSKIDQLLHDADRAAMGADFAVRMLDLPHAMSLSDKAAELYRAALSADPDMTDPAWKEGGNRSYDWLMRNGFAEIWKAGRR
jgi:hypothetical protein